MVIAKRNCAQAQRLVAALGTLLISLTALLGFLVMPASASKRPAAPRSGGPRMLQFQALHGTTLGSYAQLWYAPINLSPMPGDNYPGDGTWAPIGTASGAGSAAFVTYASAYPGAPRVAVAWLNQQYVRSALYAGTSQPGGTWPNQGAIPITDQPSLIAAFEGGFIFNVAHGGWYEAGNTGVTLVNGAASLVQYDNGTLDIGAWGSDVTMGPNVYAVRQNLVPLVADGQVTPEAQYNPLTTWGYSLGQLLYTWRSGIGITANGNLIWVGGPGLSPQVLGEVLVWAGAIRAMQLDINPLWVNFASYTYLPASGISGNNLLASMSYPPSHYLSGFWRDFVAVFLR